jgi:hypothetical protein
MTAFSAKFLPFVPSPPNFAQNFGEIFALAREIYANFWPNKGLFKRNTGLGQRITLR